MKTDWGYLQSIAGGIADSYAEAQKQIEHAQSASAYLLTMLHNAEKYESMKEKEPIAMGGTLKMGGGGLSPESAANGWQMAGSNIPVPGAERLSKANQAQQAPGAEAKARAEAEDTAVNAMMPEREASEFLKAFGYPPLTGSSAFVAEIALLKSTIGSLEAKSVSLHGKLRERDSEIARLRKELAEAAHAYDGACADGEHAWGTPEFGLPDYCTKCGISKEELCDQDPETGRCTQCGVTREQKETDVEHLKTIIDFQDGDISRLNEHLRDIKLWCVRGKHRWGIGNSPGEKCGLCGLTRLETGQTADRAMAFSDVRARLQTTNHADVPVMDASEWRNLYEADARRMLREIARLRKEAEDGVFLMNGGA